MAAKPVDADNESRKDKQSLLIFIGFAPLVGSGRPELLSKDHIYTKNPF
ncbi:hypothetical protein HCH_06435 [Hahella chejuensis KCTC 2396]|uniref:Uncharacterized protein n=1 Tax=Hahella chejuensis (strain KCTC 2396) TaxID=349521 RepID=Q2S8E4_HAHCH|nr:hypothetical protein HCH_06435 [Hahella chejuensis KCTC 2396]